MRSLSLKNWGIHVVDENKAPLIKEMFELYATGIYSIKKLLQIMNDKGLRTKKGNKLSKSVLHQLLTNPFYYGVTRWNGDLYEGKQESLIPKDIFNTVQNILHQKTTPKYRKHFTVFKGLIKCSECHGTITWEIQKGHWYGHCNHYRDCSQKKFMRQEIIEEQVLQYFDRITVQNKKLADWIIKALKESHSEKIEYQQKCLNELNAQLKRLQTRTDVLYNDRLDSRIDTETYDRKYKEICDEKGRLLHAIKNLGEAEKEYFDLGVNILELSQKAGEIFRNADTEKKRDLLSFVFSDLIINANEGRLNVTYRKPFEIIAQKTLQINNGSKVPENLKKAPENFEPLVYRQENALTYSLFEQNLRDQDSNLD